MGQVEYIASAWTQLKHTNGKSAFPPITQTNGMTKKCYMYNVSAKVLHNFQRDNDSKNCFKCVRIIRHGNDIHFVFLAWHIILKYMRKTFCTSCNNLYWLSDLEKSLLCLRLVQRRIKDNPITDYFEVHRFLLQVSGITGRRFSTGISHGTILIC